MIDPHRIEDALGRVNNQETFLQTLLAETLGWPLRETAKEIEDASFEWTAEELRASDLDKHVVDSHIWQLRRFDDQQEWGVFIIEFKNDSAFTKGRGLTGPLRKILRGLVPNARRRSDLPAWDRDNLIFICTHNYQHFRFAYFKPPKEKGQAAPLSTFGWGPDIPNRTACEFNLPALQWPENFDKWTISWQAAFDKEKLSKLFFDQYKALADILRSDLKKQSGDLNWAHDYMLQFLNRIMFLHFIQRKRWLGNDCDFLKSYWDEYRTGGQPKDTFFDKWLKVLFFEAFNNKFNHGHSHFSPRIKDALAQAPYLNGGLFTENVRDREGDTYDITISDDRIGQMLAFFGKYNFTVSEDTPLDKDVAVDPEMIGMVYESLVNISEDEDRRGEAGIFYTPRVEIDMMCRLALVDWLTNHLGTQHKELLYKWVFAYDEKDKNNATALVATGKLTDPLKQLLSGITLLDPACGSGSFLVGMLHILDDLQERLEKCDKVSRSTYERRKEIIGSNLYGVDIKDWACHVAELRLWLTLIIDVDMTAAELHVRREPLLPNFSFNIRCGDSLVQEVGGVDMAHRSGSLELSHRIKLKLAELKKEKARFYNNDTDRKCETALELEQMEVVVFRDLLEDRIKTAENKAKDLMRIQAQSQAHQQRNLLTGELEGPAKQFTLDRAQREKDIAALMEEKTRLENALNGLRSKASTPFVWDIAFAEIFGGEKNGFDVVIGNPPYVRQENIANPNPHIDRKQSAQPEAKKEYKAKIARSVYKAFPRYFDYKEATDKPARHNLNKKSDLYIYFYFKGLSLLNDRGTFCFITSNSWLDVGYGANLQEFLLRRGHVKMVMDNKAKRSFKSADVNTVIVLLGAPLDKKVYEDASLANTARFVMFNIPFENAVSAEMFIDVEKATGRVRRDAYRTFAASQQDLLEEGLEQREEESPKPKKKAKSPGISIKIAKYISNKWGAKYLKAPEIYWVIVEKYGDKLIPLNKVAEICRGITTGCNEFFFLEPTGEEAEDDFVHLANGDGWSGILERSVLRFGVQKVKECETPVFQPKKFLFCPPDKLPLCAKKYIQYGEDMGYEKRPTCRARDKWWKLRTEEQEIPPLGFNYNIHDTGRSYISTMLPTYYSDSFHILRSVYPKALQWFMRSTLFHFFVNIDARTVFGGGKAKLQTYELARLYCIKDFTLATSYKSFSDTYGKLCHQKEQYLIQELQEPVQRAIDEIVFDIIGLSKKERYSVYEAVVNLVESRLSKASSLSPKRVEKRLDAVDATTGIWLGSPSIVPDDDEEE